MATYTIVSSTKPTLGPGEIRAGTTINVANGDIFIVSSGANSNITFAAASGGPHDFSVQFNATNTNTFSAIVGSNLKPSVTVADNVKLNTVDIAAQASNGLTFNAGVSTSLRKLDGSNTQADTITVGNGFRAYGDWNLLGGDDTITGGDNVTFLKLKTGTGNDSVTFGDGTSFGEIDTEGGNDSIWLGDNATGNAIKAGDGNDFIRTGAGQNINTVDGALGTDTYRTQTTGTNSSNMENTRIVCFLAGTAIRTLRGTRRIEALEIGDPVWTRDHGHQPLRWIGRFAVSAAEAQDDARFHPVRVAADALGDGVPARDLLVSQQHRLLVRNRIAERMFGASEVLVAAKKLVGAKGIAIVPWAGPLEYLHIVFDRHEVVEAEGAETESMLIAPQALAGLDPAQGAALLRAVAFLETDGEPAASARPIIQKRGQIDQLVARAQANGKALQEAVGELARVANG